MEKNKALDKMVEKLLAGDRRMAARMITLVENENDEHHGIMQRIYPHSGKATVIGITGSGGAGKSTLTNHLIEKFRNQGKTVGVVMVDPSSPFSGGAFLGDRIRLQKHFMDDGVYIRSMASRGFLGGLSRATYDVIRIIEALGMDIIIIETLGAGQDEIDVIHIAHTCLLVMTPNMGDDIQAMKAGIMEIGDIIVLNKADLDGAQTCARQIKNAISIAGIKPGAWIPKIIPTVSVASKPEDLKGIDELVATIQEHLEFLDKTRELDQARYDRAELELGLIFKDELQNIIFKGLKGTGKKRQYLESILKGENDPYSIVDEVLTTYLKPDT